MVAVFFRPAICLLLFGTTAANAESFAVKWAVSIPKSAGPLVKNEVGISYTSNGHFLTSCKVVTPSADSESNEMACSMFYGPKTQSPKFGISVGFQSPEFDGVYQPPTSRNKSQRWVGPSDYPAASTKHDESGMAVIAISLSADGSEKSCSILHSSGHPLIDMQISKLVCRRSELLPATLNGKPVASINVLAISMTITP